MEVAFVPPVLRVPRTGRITHIQEQAGGAYLVSFDSILSIDQAEQLAGHSVLVRKADLPEAMIAVCSILSDSKCSHVIRAYRHYREP